MTRLRILVGINRLGLGGTQVNAVETAWALRERGHEVSCFAEREEAMPLLDVAQTRGVEIELLEPAGGSVVRLARAISQVCERQRIDAIHAYSSWLGWATLLGTYRRRGTPVVTTEYAMSVPRWVAPGMPLIVGTEELAKEVSAWHRGPVVLVEPPVDTDRDSAAAVDGSAFRREHGIGDDEVVIGSVSRLVLMKLGGVERTIDVVGELGRPDVRFVIVGGGDDEDRVRARARGVNERLGREAVLTVGPLSDPRAAYAAADVMVAMGGSAIRSLAFGKPLVVLGDGGFSLPFGPETEAVFYEQGFYGVEDGAVPLSRLTEQLVALIDDPERRAALGSRGRQVAVERYSLGAAAGRIEGLLDELTGGGRAASRWLTDAAYTSGYRAAVRLTPRSLRDRVRALIRR